MPILTACENYTMVAAGGTKTFATTGVSNVYNLNPNGGTTVSLGVDLAINPAGTPGEGMQYLFNYGGLMAYDGGTVTIFSRLLTAAEALSKFTITCTYTNAAWVVKFLFSDLSSISGIYLADGTVTGSTKLIAGTVSLSKLVVGAARGYAVRAGVGGVWEAYNAVTSGNLIVGNGTDVTSVAMSADATIDGTGALTIANNAITTAKILAANVTSSKLATTLLTDNKSYSVSFESGEVGAYKIKMTFSGSATNAYAAATKAIAATDAATVIIKNNAGTTMTCTTPISFAASDAFGTAYDTAITANNTFVAGDIITVNTAKPTAGGKALVTITFLRS